MRMLKVESVEMITGWDHADNMTGPGAIEIQEKDRDNR